MYLFNKAFQVFGLLSLLFQFSLYIITDVQNDNNCNTALDEAYTRIHQSVNPN
ncbi:hypothetical protein [Monoglobus pectinilyticus]|uniref:hypothetical protein n=1 Tax=Monoglobus pectinilyticus TaxID=1981510 RepID=UPI00399A9432